MEKYVLILEDDEPFLDATSRMLKKGGYAVQGACDLRSAIDLLEKDFFHVMICDINLDNDHVDISGLRFAQDGKYRHIPKIILTGQANMDYALQALTVDDLGTAPAMRFLEKDEPEVLLATLNDLFDKHLGLNQNLEISSRNQPQITLSSILTKVAPYLEPSRFAPFMVEIDALFRGLFQKSREIQLEKVIWEKNGKVAIAVETIVESLQRQWFLLICGTRSEIEGELELQQKYGPIVPTSQNTSIVASNLTTNFGALLLNPPGFKPGKANSLKGTELDHASLDSLFQTLSVWRPAERIQAEGSLGSWCQAFFHSKEHASSKDINACMKHFFNGAAAKGIQVKDIGDEWILEYQGRFWEMANPLNLLTKYAGSGEPLFLLNSPGVDPLTVLKGKDGETWLTDFSQAAQVPPCLEVGAVEIVLRCDLNPVDEIRGLMDQSLKEWAYGDLTRETQVNSASWDAVHHVRHHAVTMGISSEAYGVGLLYGALWRFLSIPDQPLREWEFVHYFKLFLVASSIKNLTTELRQSPKRKVEKKHQGLWISSDDGSAYVDDKRISLSKQGLKLLQYLYERRGQICSRVSLGKHLFGQDFNDRARDVTRLNTAISRLRRQLGETTDKRYIYSEQSRGYILACKGTQQGA